MYSIPTHGAAPLGGHAMASAASPDSVTLPESGYDATFEPEVERKYMCAVCLLVLRDAVQTKCGHRFCKECLRRSCGGNIRFAKCPVDNTWLDIIRGTFDDIATRREILSLTVRCRNQADQCDWLGELRDLEEHESSCPKAIVACENQCGVFLHREEMQGHTEMCTRRMVPCTHCHENIISVDLTKHELLTCPRFPVTCAMCQMTGLCREDIPRHVDLVSGDCPKVTVRCAFSHVGCYFQTTRQNMENHHKEENHHHLLLLVARMARQEEQLTSQNEMLDRVFSACTELTQLSANHESQMLMAREVQQTHTMHIHDLQHAGCSGRLLWKINLPEDNTCQLRSPYFYTGRPGYRLSLTLELASFRDYNEIYSSIFVNLEKGDYDGHLKFPFEGVCHVTIHDQSQDLDACNRTFTTTVVCSRVPRCYDEGSLPGGRHQRGRLKVMKTNELLGGPYVDQGTLLLQIDALHFHAGDGLN